MRMNALLRSHVPLDDADCSSHTAGMHRFVRPRTSQLRGNGIIELDSRQGAIRFVGSDQQEHGNVGEDVFR